MEQDDNSESSHRGHPYYQTPFWARRRQINITKDLPHQNAYTLALNGEFSHVAFDEMRAPENKGKWRSDIFKVPADHKLDLEIGTGNGTHFAWYTQKNPKRCLVGVELKYKPLIQSIRRASLSGNNNAAICRYHAFNLDLLFAEGELDNVMIHFPDPWTTPNKPKNRFVSAENLNMLHKLQKPGAVFEFKTDSREYFLWAREEIAKSPYNVEFETLNLHQSEMNAENFQTQFEKIFMRQGIEINYIRLTNR